MVAAPLRLCFFQHLLDFSFGAAVGHAGPVGSVAEDRTDLLVGEFAEDPEGEHLLVRFFQPVEALVDGKGGVFVDEQFVQVRLRGSGGRASVECRRAQRAAAKSTLAWSLTE